MKKFFMNWYKVELKHTVEILHEEQERIVKIEAIKKSLEVEVKVRYLNLIYCKEPTNIFKNFHRIYLFAWKK